MTDAELIAFASKFRKGLLAERSSEMMCFAVAWPLSSLLRLHGVNTDIVEGDLGECNHFWLEMSDGRVLDPTADQFNYVNDEQLPPVYLGPPTKIHQPVLT